jgi:O-methyltransferase
LVSIMADWKFPLKRMVDGRLSLSDVCKYHTYHNSIVDDDRQLMLRQLIGATRFVKGDIAEVGVYKGGTARLIAEFAADNVFAGKKLVHLYDTFTGMPPTGDEDLHNEGDFNDVSFDEVKASLKDYIDIVRFYVGFFPDTYQNTGEMYSFVHVDCDIYQSVLDCCGVFIPKLNLGGIIVFDDYGGRSTPGAKKAVDEYCKTQGIDIIYLPTGQAFYMRS